MKNVAPDFDFTKQEGLVGSIIDKHLLTQRVLYMDGIVGGSMAHEINEVLRVLASVSTKPITIYLNTPGGMISDGLSIYDTIMEIKKKCPVNMIATGQCMSMGVILMQAATKRMSQPNTTFLLHELRTSQEGDLAKLKDDIQHCERYQKTLNEIVSKRTGYSVVRLKKLFDRKDFYLTAAEAKRRHLIDAIVT